MRSEQKYALHTTLRVSRLGTSNYELCNLREFRALNLCSEPTNFSQLRRPSPQQKLRSHVFLYKNCFAGWAFSRTTRDVLLSVQPHSVESQFKVQHVLPKGYKRNSMLVLQWTSECSTSYRRDETHINIFFWSRHAGYQHQSSHW